MVIDISRTLFAQFGIPEVVVTDNGSCFVSEDFETFLVTNGTKHITSAPYHSSTNGLAVRAVQTVKKGLKKSKEGSLSFRLAKLLISYRAAPHSTNLSSCLEGKFVLVWISSSHVELHVGKEPDGSLQ